MSVPTVNVDEAWGRGWAAEAGNRRPLRRLLAEVDTELARQGLPAGQVDEAARSLLDGWNRDAVGAGTVLARALTADDSLDRAGAAEFWAAAGGDDGTDAVMYGEAADGEGGDPRYGDGPLVGFLVGAVTVARG